ncbi:MAG: DUF4251 domain-containing protein [Bacteroidales bacterium]|nr:DUF4251 domain-containing protein [Bacteroidales bacterium]
MKKIVYKIFACLIFMAFMSCSSTKNIAKDNSEIVKIVENGYYKLDIDRIVTSSILYTHKIRPEGFLKVYGDKVTADLPFFGIAYTANMQDSGIKIDSPIKDLKIKNKGNVLEVKFKTGSPKENFDVFISIYYDSTFMLIVHGSNRESISYTGVMEQISN